MSQGLIEFTNTEGHERGSLIPRLQNSSCHNDRAQSHWPLLYLFGIIIIYSYWPMWNHERLLPLMNMTLTAKNKRLALSKPLLNDWNSVIAFIGISIHSKLNININIKVNDTLLITPSGIYQNWSSGMKSLKLLIPKTVPRLGS